MPEVFKTQFRIIPYRHGMDSWFTLESQSEEGGRWSRRHDFSMEDFSGRLTCYLKFAAEKASNERSTNEV